MTHATSRTLNVDALARVEGEGAMTVRVRDSEVVDVQLRIYEPPRFFEAFLRGRNMAEVPDITARICGICPVAYQMSSCRAIEQACGVRVDPAIDDLRRLLYCGEWIESHALHIYLLHAPDFLGYPSAIELARDNRAIVERGLRLKKVGNRLMEIVGGRAIHPINVRVGGFYRAPSRDELRAFAEELRWARDAALETVAWVGGFEFPAFDGDYELVAIDEPERYPIMGDHLVSTRGLDIDVRDFEDHVVEEHVAHSNALHAHLRERGAYFVGPLARFALHHERLSSLARAAAAGAGLTPAERNPFRSIVVRAVETVYACDEALRIIGAYEEPDRPSVVIEPRAASGTGCTEAPRGILYHRYAISAEGLVEDAKIVPPTSQNQAQIEDDLRRFVSTRLDLPAAELTARCEQAIRNYDPCISCATHFLALEIEEQS